MEHISIVKVKHLLGYILKIQFSDGHISIVDFSSFIFSGKHPDYEQYRDTCFFVDFDIVDGNLNWHDYNMIFPIEELYENNVLN
ncbi:TPA: DUF2442 domain-containing protein [Vibrio harveyi]